MIDKNYEALTDQELLDRLQEECAEVIQEVSKVRRFGLDDSHPKYKGSNRERLTAECSQVWNIISILDDRKVIYPDN